MTEGNGRFIVVKSWHTLVMVVTLCGGILLSFAFTKFQADDTARRVDRIENESVRQEQLQDVQRRLQRIEDKLDRQQERTRR